MLHRAGVYGAGQSQSVWSPALSIPTQFSALKTTDRKALLHCHMYVCRLCACLSSFTCATAQPHGSLSSGYTAMCVWVHFYGRRGSCSRKGLAIQTSSMTVVDLSAFTQKSGSVTGENVV